MADPKRLEEGASPLHRALLSAGERRFEPPAGAFEAVWGGVAAQVIPGAAGGAGAATTAAGGSGATGGAAATSAAGSLAPSGGVGAGIAKGGGVAAAKWVLIVVASLGATAGAALLTRAAMRDPLPPGSPVAPVTVTAAPGERAAPTSDATFDVLPAPEPTWNATVVPTATASGASGDRLPAGGDAFHGGAVSTRPRPSTLPEETATIIRAREDIQRGAPAEALRVLDAFEHDHRGGLLGEERELLRVRALSALGDPRAKTRAAAFVARHPQSSYADRFRPFAQ